MPPRLTLHIIWISRAFCTFSYNASKGITNAILWFSAVFNLSTYGLVRMKAGDCRSGKERGEVWNEKKGSIAPL